MPTEAYLFSSAGVIQWQNASFPSWTSPVRPRPPALIEALDSSGVSFLARAASVSSESKVPGRFRFCKALLRLAVARSAASTDKRIEFVGDYLGLGVVPLDHLETRSRLVDEMASKGLSGRAIAKTGGVSEATLRRILRSSRESSAVMVADVACAPVP